MIELSEKEWVSLQADILRMIAKSNGFDLTEDDDKKLIEPSDNPRLKNWQSLAVQILIRIEEL